MAYQVVCTVSIHVVMIVPCCTTPGACSGDLGIGSDSDSDTDGGGTNVWWCDWCDGVSGAQ